MNQQNNEIPDHIKDHFFRKYEKYPSQTDFGSIKKDGIDLLLKKNEIIWYKRELCQNQELYNEGVVEYGNNKIHIYFKRSEGGTSYRLIILTIGTKEDNTLKMLINGLKPYLNLI